MKKSLATILALILFIGVFLSCASREHDQALAGTWAWNDNNTYQYVFYSDGRGYRDFSEPTRESLEWWTQGDDNLIMKIGRVTEHWGYSINESILILTSEKSDNISYVRVDVG